MEGPALCLIAWTLAAVVTGSDGQCNSAPTYLVAEQGKMSSLDFQFAPSNTTNNTVCHWVISSSDGSRLRLTADTFDLRSENGSCFDNFTVYDGNTSHSPLLLSSCSGLGSPIYSSGSDVFISFITDSTYTDTEPRFAISYESKMQSSANCSFPVRLHATNKTQELVYSSRESSLGNTCWRIGTTSPNSSVTLNLTDIEIDFCGGHSCTCDIFFIRYEDKIHKVCGVEKEQYFVSSSDILVLFRPYFNYTRRNFRLTYRNIAPKSDNNEACRPGGLHITVDRNQQSLKFPVNLSPYPSDACWWFFVSGSGHVVHLTFTYIDVQCLPPDCGSDSLHVLDGSFSNEIETLCGYQTRRHFYSTRENMTIWFESNSSVIGTGFNVVYEAVAFSDVYPPAVCTSRLLLTAQLHHEKFLQFPNVWTEDYRNIIDCGWLIQADSDNNAVHVILLSVNIGSSVGECDSDCVEIFDGSSSLSSSLGKICSIQTHGEFNEFYSSSRDLFVKFYSSNIIIGRHMHLSYESVPLSEMPSYSGGVCNYQAQPLTVSFDAQILQYPGSFSNYPMNTDCAWLLQTTSYDYVVHVTFTFLDTERSSSCSYDYVQLFDGSTTYSHSLGKVCGQTLGEFYSSGRDMYIKFHSDESNTGRGFQLTYQAVSSWNVPTTPRHTTKHSHGNSGSGARYPSGNHPDNSDSGNQYPPGDDPDNFDYDDDSMDVGRIAGVAVGGTVGFIVVVAAIVILVRRQRVQQLITTVPTNGYNQIYTCSHPGNYKM